MEDDERNYFPCVDYDTCETCDAAIYEDDESVYCSHYSIVMENDSWCYLLGNANDCD